MRSRRAWMLYAILLTSMIYSALALTAKPVAAAGCDCNQAYQTAQQICSTHGGVIALKCANGGTYYDFVCGDYVFFRFSCS